MIDKDPDDLEYQEQYRVFLYGTKDEERGPGIWISQGYLGSVLTLWTPFINRDLFGTG